MRQHVGGVPLAIFAGMAEHWAGNAGRSIQGTGASRRS